MAVTTLVKRWRAEIRYEGIPGEEEKLGEELKDADVEAEVKTKLKTKVLPKSYTFAAPFLCDEKHPKCGINEGDFEGQYQFNNQDEEACVHCGHECCENCVLLSVDNEQRIWPLVKEKKRNGQTVWKI